jgi:thioredoxin 1
MAIELTKELFEEKVADLSTGEFNFKGDKPALIDFWAEWCGPCKMVGPIVEELSQEYEGQIDIYKLDTEAEPELAAQFGIQSIPSLLFIPSEGQPQMAVGALPKDTFKKAFKDIFNID